MTTDTNLTCLGDPDRDVRLATAFALGSAASSEAVPALVARLGAEEDPTVRETLTWACVQHAEAALPLVLEAMGSPDAATRAQAAHVASKIGGAGITEALSGVIADDDNEVAIKAYRAAASTLDPAVVPALVARLGEGDLELRDALAVAFERLGALGVPALVEAVGSERAEVRAHAAEALAHVGSPDADGAVTALQGLLDDADGDVRMAAVMALGALDAEVSGPALAAAAGNGDHRVARVAEAFSSR